MVVGNLYRQTVTMKLHSKLSLPEHTQPEKPISDFPLRKPILVFDGDCAFCRVWSARIERWSGGAVECVSMAQAADRFPQVVKEGWKEAVGLLDADGNIYRGAEAVLRSLALSPRRSFSVGLGIYRHVPGAAPLFELAYRFIARHRYRISGSCSR